MYKDLTIFSDRIALPYKLIYKTFEGEQFCRLLASYAWPEYIRIAFPF